MSFLGIDLGTTGIKCAVYNEDGQMLAGYGTGKFYSIESVLEKWVKIGKEFEPDTKKYKKYSEKYCQWLEVSGDLDRFKIMH